MASPPVPVPAPVPDSAIAVAPAARGAAPRRVRRPAATASYTPSPAYPPPWAAPARTHGARAPKWPKHVPPLTAEQTAIGNDFMAYWHSLLPRHFSLIERFNHGYPVWHAPRTFKTTLEIGAGLGEHIVHEPLTAEQQRHYYALELRPNMARAIQERFPKINSIVGDCQERLDFPDGYFDRILAIHVLEHLPNLPATVREAYRLCDKQRGVLSVVIPCEGSPAYTLARRISAQRVFEKRYGQSYQWFISREHINRPHEIMEELKPYFATAQRSFFPLLLPTTTCNLCIGLTLRPRKGAPRGGG